MFTDFASIIQVLVAAPVFGVVAGIIIRIIKKVIN